MSLAWDLPRAPIAGKDVVYTKLNPLKDVFTPVVPAMKTYDDKEIPVTDNLLTLLRGNPEDRSKSHHIDRLVRVYQKGLPEEDTREKGCDTTGGSGKISALIQQDFVQRYLRTDTPERGLLIYHGLGSGKTATSIGLIEANRSAKRIIVLLPASLEDNYRLDIAKIAPTMFGKGTASLKPYEWYFHRIDTDRIEAISADTGIPADIIHANGGIYRVMEPGESDASYTWDEMSPEQQSQLGKQIVGMMMAKIEFEHYNGMSLKYAYSLDFSDAIIVIDEVHNVSGMVRNRGGGKQEGIGKILYQKIRDAKNAKVIALSGTPVVNSPFEIAVLANMINGSQNMTRVPFTVTRTGESASDASVVEDILKDPIVRYANIVPSDKAGGGSELILLRHPPGFESIYAGDNYAGILHTNRPFTKSKKWLEDLNGRLRESGIEIHHDRASSTRMLWFPESESEFMKLYTNPGEEGTDNFIKHRDQLIRRLMLVSFYRGADPSKYPRTRDIQIVRTQMNDQQFDEYARARFDEIEQARKQARQKGAENENDVFTGRYRSRQLCSVYFPEGRPTKSSVKYDLEMRGIVGADAVMEEYNKRLDVIMDKLRSVPDLGNNIETYSPKYAKVIELLEESDGLALLYSSFLRMEGLESLSIFLEAKGYVPFEIVIHEDVPRIKAMIEKEDTTEKERFLKAIGKRFMIFSGANDKVLRTYLIRIYRGRFTGLPESLIADLESILGDKYSNDGKANLHGELCRILEITGAGAEGLDLQNIRQVHVLEPYWNKARIDQVFGRAVRVCSHANLDDSERTVERYIHVSTFPDELYRSMISRGDNRFLESSDDGFSTDEYLYNLAMRKDRNNESFLRLLKQAAVDCILHASANDISPRECAVMPHLMGSNYRFGVSPNYKDDADDNTFTTELRDTIVIEFGRSIYRVGSKEIELGPMTAAVDYKTLIAYDADLLVIRKLHRIGIVEIIDDDVSPTVTLVLNENSLTPTPDGDGSDIGRALGVPVTGASGAPKAGGAPDGGSGSGIEERLRKAMGAVSTDVRYELAKGLGEYVPFMSELDEPTREENIRRLVRSYTDHLQPYMFPSEVKEARVFVLSIGHPGSGKTRFTNEILDSMFKLHNPTNIYAYISQDSAGNYQSIPVSKQPLAEQELTSDDFVRIGVDEILSFMTEYRERLVVDSRDNVNYVDSRVIGDPVLRRIANEVSKNLLNRAIAMKAPILYETTFVNTRNVIENVANLLISKGYYGNIYSDTREEGGATGASAAAAGAAGGGDDLSIPAPKEGAFDIGSGGEATPTDRIYPYSGQFVVLNFFNSNLTATKERVKKRFEQEGRFVPIDSGSFSVDSIWKESKKKRGLFKDILLAKRKTKYTITAPADMYIEIDTTEVDRPRIVNETAFIGLGMIRGRDFGEYSSDEIILDM